MYNSNKICERKFENKIHIYREVYCFQTSFATKDANTKKGKATNMKKRILSFLLVLTFILCALPICVSAEETGTGNTFEEWSAQVGSISKLDGGVFQINTGNGHRQAIWNGTLEEGKITVTFDVDSIFAGHGGKNPDGTQKSGANDTAIIFGGNGVKASTATSVSGIENQSSYYALMFSDNNLRIALVDKAWKGNSSTYPEAADVNVSVNLATELKDAWTGIKASGKVELTVEFTKTGAVKVYVNGNHVDKLDRAAGTCVPFGGEVGVRCGNGFHVPTKIYNVNIEKNTNVVVDGWSAKLGSVSPLEGGLFQINAFDESKPTSVNNVKGQRQAMWNGSLNAGKVSITFDWESIIAGRGDGSNGANDTAIIFGGSGIAEAAGNNINQVESNSCYYVVMFSNENLRIARIQNEWQGGTDKFPAAISGVKLATELGDDWTEAKADGKIKLTVEFTETGAVKVYVDDMHVEKLDRAEGSCVPFGGEVGVRCGNGFHVPTKIYEVAIEEAVNDLPGGEQPGDTGNENPGDTNPGNENTDNEDSEDNIGTPSDDNDGNDDNRDNKDNKDDKKNDATLWIVIAVVAVVVIAGAVVGVVAAKKKK